MNGRIILYVLGWILQLEGVLMLPSSLVGLIYREGSWLDLLIVALCSIVVGRLLTWKKPENSFFYQKEGFVTTGLCWILLSLVGCLPFWISGEIPSFTDALFETISGFTTTGASILEDVEALSHCMLFWRSFTHWIGGMGVLVFLLMVVQMSGGSHMNLMRAESPGPTVGKLVPKVAYNARILYAIYFCMTLLEVVFLLVGRMSLFDALTTAFGTAGTGGFGIYSDSLASASPYVQWVVTIFMVLFGVNFNLYSLLLFRRWKQALSMEEVKCYLLVIVAAVALILVNLGTTLASFWENLRMVSFQVASIITTTGFATVDFDQWPTLARTILVMLMFVGACAGSTGGGIKVSRFLLVVKNINRELHHFLHPKSICGLKVDGKPVEQEVMRSVNVYFTVFMMLFATSVLLVSLDGFDLTTNFTAVAATINNIGPGLSMVGPTCNFSFFSPLVKYVLMFDMLAGRLELFPILLLFYPPVWKGCARRRHSRCD